MFIFYPEVYTQQVSLKQLKTKLLVHLQSDTETGMV